MATRIAPFVPTPLAAISRAVSMAQVCASDVVFDLGSGDGRVVIEAAKSTMCLGIGVEIDGDLVVQARNAARAQCPAGNALFAHGSLFNVDAALAHDLALPVVAPPAGAPTSADGRHQGQQESCGGRTQGQFGSGGKPPRSRAQRARDAQHDVLAAGTAALRSPAGDSSPDGGDVGGATAALLASSATAAARRSHDLGVLRPYAASGLGLCHATVCYLFMGDWDAHRLLPLMRASLQPGSRVVSCGYSLLQAPATGDSPHGHESWLRPLESSDVMDLTLHLYEVIGGEQEASL